MLTKGTIIPQLHTMRISALLSIGMTRWATGVAEERTTCKRTWLCNVEWTMNDALWWDEALEWGIWVEFFAAGEVGAREASGWDGVAVIIHGRWKL